MSLQLVLTGTPEKFSDSIETDIYRTYGGRLAVDAATRLDESLAGAKYVGDAVEQYAAAVNMQSAGALTSSAAKIIGLSAHGTFGQN